MIKSQRKLFFIMTTKADTTHKIDVFVTFLRAVYFNYLFVLKSHLSRKVINLLGIRGYLFVENTFKANNEKDSYLDMLFD